MIITDNELLLKKSAIKWVNEYYEKEDYILLKVFRKDLTESYDILIDKSDFGLVSQGQWYGHMGRKNTHLKDILHILWTHFKNGKRVTYDIYQWILDSKNENLIIDHKNMNRLDNRKQNLRFVTAKENSINQEHTGWCYREEENKYYAYICCDGNGFHLGGYSTKAEAEEIYLKAYMIMEYDKISETCKSRIQISNIKLVKNDYSNKYLKRLVDYKNYNILPDKNTRDEYKRIIKLSTFQGNGRGYNFDKLNNKYLVRIKINNKEINIGRYNTEKEANEIYLKACIIIGKDNQYSQISERINENNIKVTNEDYNNKYLKKVYNLYNNTKEQIPNGKFNYIYDESMNIIIDLIKQEFSWHKIAQYLRNNIKGLEGAKGETVRRKYEKYITNNK